MNKWIIRCLLLLTFFAFVRSWAGVFVGRVDIEEFELAQRTRDLKPPPTDSGPHSVQVRSTRRVVPAPGVDDALLVHQANNNLDVARHQGRVYLAFRNAPNHFASADARIHVVSSRDERVWRHEATYHLGRDLREPRLLSWNDKLVLFVTVLGSNPYAFEPEGFRLAERRGDGDWSALEPLYKPGYIAWRARVERGVPYLIAYRGDNMYALDGPPMTVDLLTTRDGRTWEPVEAARSSVYVGGGSETDFAIVGDSLLAVVRNERGDTFGWGSSVCSAEVGDLTRWSCRGDGRKFDSPAVFTVDGEVYLIARRNVTETGAYDVSPGWGLVRTVGNELAYIREAKRCSLWRVDRERLVHFVLDLPSRGDTCFPGVLSDESGRVTVYDYSSAIDGPDVPWSVGQRGPTFIYRHELLFEKSGGG